MTIEEAIKVANEWLIAGEGIDLLYHMRGRLDLPHPECAEAFAVLAAALNPPTVV